MAGEGLRPLQISIQLHINTQIKLIAMRCAFFASTCVAHIANLITYYAIVAIVRSYNGVCGCVR